MLLVCLDPGIVSVGVFVATVDTSWSVTGVIACTNVDLTTSRGPLHAQISAFLQAWSTTMSSADSILLERQPFQSAGFPLELLMRERFLEKCVFISPNTLHKHFGSAGYTYDGRKDRAVRIVTATLESWRDSGVDGCDTALATIHSLTRKHDCCDACLLLLYHIYHGRQQSPPVSIPVPLEPDFDDLLRRHTYSSEKPVVLVSRFFHGGS